MKRTVKVAYTDWWAGFSPEKFVYNEILSKYYNIEVSDNPDYVFCSLYSYDCLKYDAIRIFYTGDNYVPDYNIYDYAISFENMQFEDRFIRVPNWIVSPVYKRDVDLMLHKHEVITDDLYDDRKFCSWVCSNGRGDPIRKDFFEKLSEYRQVDSGGRYLNNIGKPEGVKDKIDFQRDYRFSIALQDSCRNGYLDEKLINCFSSKTIPVFWGDQTVEEMFNKESFINLHNYDSLEGAIEEIKRLDSDKNEYLRRLRIPAMKKPEYVQERYEALEKFLLHIFEQPIEKARRRTVSTWGNFVRDLYSRAYSERKKKKGIKDIVKSIF